MDIKKINEELAVCGQISPADVQLIADQGFKTIICNRPDGEAEDQPDFLAIKKAADLSGLAVKFLPISPKFISDEDAESFATGQQQSQKPVLAYCRTGTRCIIAWALAEGKNGSPIEQIISTAAVAGYDISKLADRLAMSQSLNEKS
ncbi:MAG: TIGR01244 family sulfur transferase [Rhizobiaceae bacterium]|nr:TIGR01244 family sulfur transferase [Rhizobiaceae bacterium]